MYLEACGPVYMLLPAFSSLAPAVQFANITFQQAHKKYVSHMKLVLVLFCFFLLVLIQTICLTFMSTVLDSALTSKMTEIELSCKSFFCLIH
jgi:hypothetical protein